ncbi:MAG: RNA polymerase factor sigma-54 [Myxococcales bacterium]|nr:RNA polymerase factor sigma-54 [Myxococcales bacterium]MDH5307561.1 RNA polymerase factor sigma-54 [Myxococcales bacterium]
MALELKQQVKLTQQLVMTPQLQQAIKLLQLSRMELVGLLQRELEENPVLEEVVEVDDEAGQESGEAQGAETGELDGERIRADALDSGPDREPTDAEKIADVDWQNYIDAHPQTGMREASADDRPSLESTLTRRETLTEHLLWQLQLDLFPVEEEIAARFIIGNIDDRGYLRSTLEELSRQSGVRAEVVEAALAKVQEFDPAGVAARDLRECLSIQARAFEIDDPLVLRIIDEQLDALIRRDFRAVSRALGVSVEEIAAASHVIGRLEPRPGRAFGGDEPVYIVPDIYVYRVGDDFHVMLNDDGLPRLRINGLYREVLNKGNAASKDTKEYVNDKVRSALWLIKSIHQRQRTIYKVMQSIIKHQRDFFERGINYLKPLNLRDVADDIEMHESTVSRVTTNKYANTPQGIFELKYFFNSSINRVEGDAIASESVKERIRRLVVNEDPRRPLSDQRIAEMLKMANIDIARRTVTKYRESMNLLSSTKRRQVG